MANTEPHVDSAGGSGEVMDRWKTDNCESGGDRLSSRSTSLSRRLIGLAGVAALTVGGAGAVLLGAGAAYASTTQAGGPYGNYTVGSGSVSGVSVVSSVTTASAASNYKITFTTPVALGTSDTITIADPASANNAVFPAIVAAGADPYTIVDNTTPADSAAISNAKAVAAGKSVTLTLGSAVAAGDQLTLDVLGATTPSAAGTYDVTVATSQDIVAVASNSYTVTAATSTPTFATTAGSDVAGATTTYTIGSLATGSAIAANQYLAIVANGVTLPSGASNYTITDSTTSSSGGTAVGTVKLPVAATSASNWDQVSGTDTGYLVQVPYAIASGDVITVTVTGVLNGSAGTEDLALYAPPTAGASGAPVTLSSTAAAASGVDSGTVAIGTSVSNASVSTNPATAGATANYMVSFTTTSSTSLISGNKVVVTAPAGTAFASGSVDVFDATTAADSQVATGVASPGTGSSTNNVDTVTLVAGIKSGDTVTLQFLGATNPAAGTYAGSTGLTVTTTNDTVPATAASYTISTAPASGSLNISLSSGKPTLPDNYTFSNFEATGAFTSTGTAASSDAIDVLVSNSTTTFPTNAAQYTITDVTNSANSGTPLQVSALTNAAVVTNGVTYNYGVQLSVPHSIAKGDVLSITVSGVVDPAAGLYSATLSAVDNQTVAANQTAALGAIAPVSVSTVPTAATTYPNGALVQSGGNQIDVIAGGVGFGIPSMSVYDLIAASDSSAVVAGSFPTATTVRTGTVLKVVGSPAIYVVGTNGDAYAFSTPTEFTSDGYSAKSVVSVPSLGSLTIGSGAAPTAAVTMPDGALVQSGTTIYVYAGGKAFGIPTWSEYQTIAAVTGSSVVQGTVSNTSATSLTAGTLIQPIGSFGIWVSDGSSIYQFSTASQFASDGYNGANVVPVPNATGLTQA